MKKLRKEREELAKKIGEAARDSYTSYGGSSIGHYLGALNAGKRAEVEALDKIYADEVELLSRLAVVSGTQDEGDHIKECLEEMEKDRKAYEEACSSISVTSYGGEKECALEARLKFPNVACYGIIPTR